MEIILKPRGTMCSKTLYNHLEAESLSDLGNIDFGHKDNYESKINAACHLWIKTI